MFRLVAALAWACPRLVRPSARARALAALVSCAPWAVASAVDVRSDASSFYANFEGLRLVDQSRRPFGPSALRGRFVVVHFVFTGCSTTCPVQTRSLVELRASLPADVRERFALLSVSIDPANDTPDRLAAFATRVGATGADWRFVVASVADTERLSRRLRLAAGDVDADTANHTTALWLVDADGRLLMRYAGVPVPVERLRRELETLARGARTASR